MAKQKDFIPAKRCYSHIGGKLGALLMEASEINGWIAKARQGKHFYVTAKGQKEFAKLGVDLSQLEPAM
jgi:hypothetical protein